MKLTKLKLQQIIKEELEKTTQDTNEGLDMPFVDKLESNAESILDHLNNKLPEEFNALRSTNWFISLESMINDLKRD